MRLSLLFLLLTAAAPAQDAAESGVLPAGVGGQPLNLDFETGDLRDWLVDGEAFRGQPARGDTVHRRRADMRSGHQGQYWVGGYEKLQDAPVGTLTSAPFRVTHPYAAFLVGGGPHQLETCVELVRRDSGEVIARTPGREREDMERVVVDLKGHMGKEIFVRLVDRHTGHWGHVNFDDFRFYKERPEFPGREAPKRVVDLYEHGGLPADKAAEVMTVPDGFRISVVAAEPDVRQPIAMAIDDRGRLWVAEAYSYPRKVPAQDAKDRILIFADTDGDGTFDQRKVFAEGLNLVSGLEVGFGGVWVGQAPELLFIPDRDGDDAPDGPPQAVLDGWAYQDTHETLNSFIWGPDGWLYGCHGVFTHSLVGKPGAPPERRTPINAGIWRYHPLKDRFEVFAHGTSNPWGVDFNDHGHSFLTCCVIPHLFHVVQGARYHRQAGSHFQPYTYADIPTIANHRHWVGNQWNDADRAKSDDSGGGHAHAGAMVYLGGQWPEKYRGQLFMNNIHGARLNVDRLTRKGSGYEGDGEPDFCKTNDLWSQILYLRYGPDGQVYMIDWYDRNQCHHGDAAGHDRSNGRVFRISYEGAEPARVDLRGKSDLELVGLQAHANDWYVRHARRLLQERAAGKGIRPEARAALEKLAFAHADVTRRLRGLWALHVTGGLSGEQLDRALRDGSEYVRSWAVQLACEDGPPADGVLARFRQMAAADPSQLVRLYLASAAQRLPLGARWDLLGPLVGHAEDAGDHNLPLMYWYAAEPLAEADLGRAFRLAADARVPLLRQFMARRVTAVGTPAAFKLLIGEVLAGRDAAGQRAILAEMQEGLKGRKTVPMPDGWPQVFDALGDSGDDGLRTLVWSLAVKFGDPTVQERMRQALLRDGVPADRKREYLQSLLAAGDGKLPPVLAELLAHPELRREALAGLARFDDPATPDVIARHYPSLSAAEKRTALATLVARPGYARALLAAVGAGRVPARDLTADLVRQLQNLRDPEVDAQVAKVWGTVRQTAADKAQLIARYKALLAGGPAPAESLPVGRAVFARTCQQCHTLFGAGGKVGPDLTGSNRADLDYLLSNVVDPSTVLAKEYTASIIETTSGRVVTGIVRERTGDAVTVVTAEETLTLPNGEVAAILPGEKSMMPDDLLKPLSDGEVKALVAYLASPRQVPLQATKDNVASLFNGKDLTGWAGDPKFWKVDGGDIVGTRTAADAPGRNEFLVSDLLAGDFRLRCRVKLSPDAGNSGLQFRSQVLPGGEVQGYQADIGAGWWGKLYEENGRGLLWDKSGEAHVKRGEWNDYEVVATGDRVRTYINGGLCVDLTDPAGRRAGVFALQLHSGQPFEVRFRDFHLEVLAEKESRK